MEKHEIKFWEIYRNIYLNKVIYSNFEFSKVYSYNRLFNVSDILLKYSNGIEILKYKVKNNEYLYFEIKGSRETFPIIILELIKKDQLFYNQLFSSNNDYYYLKNFNINELINKIIKSSNLEALKSFIKNNKNQIINYNDKFQIINYKSLKMLKYLKNSGVVEITNIEFNDTELFKNSFKLKHLIEILKFSKIENNELLLLESKLFTNLSINQILNEYSILISNNKEEKETQKEILKLINLFYLLINKNENEIPLNYFILFKKDLNEIENKIYKDYKNGIYSNEQHECFYNLFKFNSNNLNQVISNLLKRINDDDTEIITNKEEIEYLLYSFIISSSNINLIDMVIKNHTINYLNNNKSILFSRIESIEILNYFFKNYQDLFFKNLNLNWINIESIQIFNHYKSLMSSLNKSLSILPIDSIKLDLLPFNNLFKKTGELFLDLLLNLIIDQNKYHRNHIINLTIFKELIYNSLNYYNKQDTFIEILKSIPPPPTTTTTSSFDLLLIENENSNNYKIIKWIFSNSVIPPHFKNSNKNEIIIRGNNLKINSVSNDKYFISLFKIGHFKEIFQFLDNNLNSRLKLINFHFSGNHDTEFDKIYYFKYITTEYIDLLFNYLNGNNKFNVKYEIMQIGYHSKRFNWESFINDLRRTGNLLIFKHLIENYADSFIIDTQFFNKDFKEFINNYDNNNNK